MFDKSFKGNVVDNEVDNVVNFLDEYNFYRQKQRYLKGLRNAVGVICFSHPTSYVMESRNPSIRLWNV